MKTYAICLLVFLFISNISLAQTSPPSSDEIEFIPNIQAKMSMISDTIDFTPYPGGTIITNQYLNDGALFMGFNGSTDPLVYDYTTTFGRVLISDNWYNPIRLNFVDSGNSSQYEPVQNIEFDNNINVQVDYISVDVYDSMNTVIYHYVSTSPEHVVINLASPSAAYITFDDSAGTAFFIDNIYFDNGTTSSGHNLFSNDDILLFPNPFHNEVSLNIQRQNIQQMEISIKNILGQTIYSLQENDPGSKYAETIDLSFLAKGIYMIDVIMDGARIVKKIVKD